MEKKQVKRWYAVHTYSGYENKVKADLERKVHSLGMENEIFCIVIPVENEIEVKNGKKHCVARKVYPGYVFLEMILNDKSWYAVRNTPGVTGFLGTPKPIPLPDADVAKVLSYVDNGDEESRPKIGFQLQQMVRLKEGSPLPGMIGKITEINEEKGRLTLLMDFMGSDKPVDVDFTQVEEIE